MLHHLVGGAWGSRSAGPLEAATMTLPLMALLFLPIILGMGSLYWAGPMRSPHHRRSSSRRVSECPVLPDPRGDYLGLWNGLAFMIRGDRAGPDREPKADRPEPADRRPGAGRGTSCHDLRGHRLDDVDRARVVFVDLRRDGHDRLGLERLAVAVIAASKLSNVRPLSGLVSPEAFNELGNLLLAFTMLWAYMGFSQFLLIWSGNLTEEIPWYLRRSYGGWRIIALAHDRVPLLRAVLLPADPREQARRRRLWWIAAGMLVMHWLNDAWLIIPAYDERHWLSLWPWCRRLSASAGSGSGSIPGN